MRTQVYLITGTLAVCSGITAICAAALIEQDMALLFFKIFAGVMSYIAVYAIVEDGHRLRGEEQ